MAVQINKEIYLGDGLYASFDGWMIRLRAPGDHGDHWIALEPMTWIQLKILADECWGNTDG